MTTSHKVVLSLIAAVCMTLIVFYSVKGNAPQPGRAPATAAGASGTTAKGAPMAPGRSAAASPGEAAPQTPVVLARAGDQKPASIDEIMARVKQLDDLKTSDAAGGDAPSTPASSNTPAATPAPVVTLNETNGATDETPTQAPSTGNVTPGGNAATPTSPASSAANAAAQVPSLTLGEPRKVPDLGAKEAGTETTSNARDGDVGAAPIEDAPLPPLTKVTPQEKEAEATVEPTATKDDAATAAANAATTDPRVIVVDPHKPAVKADAPAASTPPATPAGNETGKTAASTQADGKKPATAIDPADRTQKPATNAQAESPRTTTDRAADTAPAPGPAAGSPYTMRPGDTFSSIAATVYGAEKHWIDIADANPGIDPKKVRAGQVITLPDLDKSDEPSASPKAPAKTDVKPAAKTDAKPDTKSIPAVAARDDAKIHQVKPGESLSSISRRYFSTPDHWRHIYLTNREVIGGEPSKLQAGMKLKITAPPKDN